MTRLIDADKLKFVPALIEPVLIGDEPHWETIILKDRIDNAPTVEAVPVVHGKWDKGTDSGWHICEECGAEVDISMGTGVWVEGVELHELKYCPVCGARMDAERKEHEQID